MGSLVAAIASYCDAKKNNGKWLLRIEDLDPPREISGASQKIIETLNAFGFQFNQEIIFQSNTDRQHAYLNALDTLSGLSKIYYCTCSRSELKKTNVSSHLCRSNTILPSIPYSINLKVPNKEVCFTDTVQGKYQKNLLLDCGDVILKRKDGLIAYQLAVVVDDNHQNISHVVRGTDLLDSTPWQIYLNHLLEYKQIQYAHIPILINENGQKLSKQTFAKEIDNMDSLNTLKQAINFLNQQPIMANNLTDFWQQAINNWDISAVKSKESIRFI